MPGFKTPFFGAHAVSRSSNYSDAQLINLYGEVEETKQGREIGALYNMPGLTQLASAGFGPINGMLQLGTGLLYIISASELFSITKGGVATDLGALHGTPPFSMIQNGSAGSQLAIFGANNKGDLYTTGGGIAAISMPFATTGQIVATYQDGFGLINNPTTTEFFASNSLDLSTWSALSFGSATGDADNVVALAQTIRLLYVFKQLETEVWVNVGSSPFPFQRLDGTYIEYGCVAPSSIAKVGDVLCWLSQTSQGQGVVMKVLGTQAMRISTSSMENEIQDYSTISDAIGYGYQFNGHEFYVLSFPIANVTWVYDKTTSDLLRTPFWFKWLTFNGTSYVRHLSNCFAMYGGMALVGSHLDGKIYKLDPTNLADGTFTRQWTRSWRALPKITQDPTRFSKLTIDMEPGATGTTGSPTVSLSWSDDGGHTFSSPITASVGALNNTTQRVYFTRLGSTKRTTGLDRIFQLQSSSVFPARIFGAELE